MTEPFTSYQPQRHDYDVVIAGGGMVGVSLACALATADKTQQITILLVDSFPVKPNASAGKKRVLSYHPSFDARSTALSMASVEIYQALGVLPALMGHAAAINQIHVSDKGHSGSTLLDAKEQEMTSFGCVIENTWLGAVLLNRMEDFPNIELFAGGSVSQIRPKKSGATVCVSAVEKNSQAQDVDARLLVIADGAQSGLRQSLGVDASVKHYEQEAIITNVQTQLPHKGLAFERFTASGAVALLPLPDLPDAKHRSALVWTLPNKISESVIDAEQPCVSDLMSFSDHDFASALQQAFGFRLGAIERVGMRQAYPLSLTVADEMIRSHIVLMGNAAHALHPVAGQGFNLALRDVAALAEHVVSHLRSQTIELGSLEMLEAYQAERLSDQDLTIELSHNLIGLFGLQSLPVQAARSAGLLALDILKPAKIGFVKQAAGLVGRHTRL